MISLLQIAVVVLGALTTLTMADYQATPSVYYRPILNHTNHHEHNYSSPSNSDFKYGVHDSNTKDENNHWEEQHGDVWHVYSSLPPDSRVRRVTYTIDKHKGPILYVYFERTRQP